MWEVEVSVMTPQSASYSTFLVCFALGLLCLRLRYLKQITLKRAFHRSIHITSNSLKWILRIVLIFTARILSLVGLVMGAPALLITCEYLKPWRIHPD